MATNIATGRLEKWNDEKGIGFILPANGEKRLFVHISSFDQNINRKPRVGDTIFYYTGLDKSGMTKALSARISGVDLKKDTSPIRYYRYKANHNGLRFMFFCVVLALIVSNFMVNKLHIDLPKIVNMNNLMALKSRLIKSPSQVMSIFHKTYSCDGRVHCSQMYSCDEAKYFIQNCPATKMDEDQDGIPCESQWCNH